MAVENGTESVDLLKKNQTSPPLTTQNRREISHVDKPWSFVVALASFTAQVHKRVCCQLEGLTWDELHKASVTERFVALRNATVRYQKALRSAM